tara:strand:- start:21461 stop:22945 length:1485 start_codon:yes stop_codon:yes gene_type:complete
MASQNTSIYPIAIDGFQQVPLFVDGKSLITADGINRYRSAIINIETTLGVAPHLSEKYDGFTTVSERLDFLDGIISDINSKVDEITISDLQIVTDNGNVTTNSIVFGGAISDGDLVVNGMISFEEIDAELNDLNDVRIDNPTVGDALVWDGEFWVSKEASINLYIDDLNDVESKFPTINNTLIWEGDKWRPGMVTLSSNDLSDVESLNAKLNDALIWKGDRWQPGKVSRAALNREEVEDIVGEMFLDADHVAIYADYKDDLGKIKLKNGIKYLESLFNVSADLPNSGDVLSWNGTEWGPIKIDIPEEFILEEEVVEDIVGLMFVGGVHDGVSVDYNDNVGSISISNEFDELKDLLDTDIVAPNDGQIISYDSADGVWKNVDQSFSNLLDVRYISTDDAEGSHFVADASVDDHVILCEFTDGGVVDFFLHLPNPCPSGKEIIIKDKNSINELGEGQSIRVVPTGGMLIDGLFEFALDTKNQSITIVCDGSNYWII